MLLLVVVGENLKMADIQVILVDGSGQEKVDGAARPGL